MRRSVSAGIGAAAPITLALAFLLPAAAATLASGSRETAAVGDAPADPPVAFSHRRHVADVGLDCQFCHAYARRGPVAGMPPLARCAGCHRVVAPDSPEVARLLARFEAEEPVSWPRAHQLPGYVRFTHKRHVRAGVACETCHGDVGGMEAVRQVAPLTMGWCMGCHEQRQASVDCLTCHY